MSKKPLVLNRNTLIATAALALLVLVLIISLITTVQIFVLLYRIETQRLPQTAIDITAIQKSVQVLQSK